MKSSTIQKLRLFFLFSLLIIAVSVSAQQTYKVICDKTDHKLKVVETENHSAKYITIKSGFPFRQVAQKWIEDNYSTTECNPDDFIKPNNTIGNQLTTVTQNTVGSNPVPSSGTALKHTFLQARKNAKGQRFRNTSFLISGRFSNLGEAFSLEEKLMFGAGAGFEQLLGGNLYLGTGIHMDLYFSAMDNRYEENEILYHFRIPAFVGYRTYSQKLVVMYEAGIGFNTRMIGTPLTIESFGTTAENNSFNFLGRLKVGSEKVMFMMGADIWLGQALENDFNMTSLNTGFCFFF